MLKEQEKLKSELGRIFDVFIASECEIRPHFILTGSSGSGKSYTIQALAEEKDVGFLEINAAQLTKEGTSGNSLSKALSPLANFQNRPVVCFVDEFDKLFISGNSNSELAHESTNGVQNEFLKVLESDTTSVFGDYGKYVNVGVSNVLFVFAGAFNGEQDIDLDRLLQLGIKTEFLGRVGLVFNTSPITLESLLLILQQSKMLAMYDSLFENSNKADAINVISEYIKKNYEKNTLGVRMVNTLIHQYYIKGGKLEEEEAEKVTFQRKLVM